MIEHKIPGLTDVDTRALTQKIRETGVMLGKIVQDGAEASSIEYFDPNAQNVVSEVSVKEPELWAYHIV